MDKEPRKCACWDSEASHTPGQERGHHREVLQATYMAKLKCIAVLLQADNAAMAVMARSLALVNGAQTEALAIRRRVCCIAGATAVTFGQMLQSFNRLLNFYRAREFLPAQTKYEASAGAGESDASAQVRLPPSSCRTHVADGWILVLTDGAGLPSPPADYQSSPAPRRRDCRRAKSARPTESLNTTRMFSSWHDRRRRKASEAVATSDRGGVKRA